jgi:Ca2+-binding RTX toxin-like protein
VQEAAGGGSDVVYASASYALAAGAEVEVLSTLSFGATTAIDLTGNAFGQTIYGNAGANVLDGLGGNDALIGFGGNDLYFVDAAGDVVQEAAGGGSDVVYASASYTLTAGIEIEVLSTLSFGATTAINLTGNALGQTIYGNAGVNVLNGLDGNDALIGFDGNDTMNGGIGNDALVGGLGNDAFLFTTALGPGNVDSVADFSVADDTIQLDDAVFIGLAGGGLAAGAFTTGTAATQADDRIVYNSATGALLFDVDGVGGAAAVQFATLQSGLGLTASDFLVI